MFQNVLISLTQISKAVGYQSSMDILYLFALLLISCPLNTESIQAQLHNKKAIRSQMESKTDYDDVSIVHESSVQVYSEEGSPDEGHQYETEAPRRQTSPMSKYTRRKQFVPPPPTKTSRDILCQVSFRAYLSELRGIPEFLKTVVKRPLSAEIFKAQTFVFGKAGSVFEEKDFSAARITVNAQRNQASYNQVILPPNANDRLLASQKEVAVVLLGGIISESIDGREKQELVQDLTSEQSYLKLQKIQEKDLKRTQIESLLSIILERSEYRRFVEGEPLRDTVEATLEFLFSAYIREDDRVSQDIMKVVTDLLSTFRKDIKTYLEKVIQFNRLPLQPADIQTLAARVRQYTKYQQYCEKQAEDAHTIKAQLHYRLLQRLKNYPNKYKIIEEYTKDSDFDPVWIFLDYKTASDLDEEVRKWPEMNAFWRVSKNKIDIRKKRKSEIQEFVDGLQVKDEAQYRTYLKLLEDNKQNEFFSKYPSKQIDIIYKKFVQTCPHYFQCLDTQSRDPAEDEWAYHSFLRQLFHRYKIPETTRKQSIEKLIQKDDFSYIEKHKDFGSSQQLCDILAQIKNCDQYKNYCSSHFIIDNQKTKAKRELISTFVNANFLSEYKNIEQLAMELVEKRDPRLIFGAKFLNGQQQQKAFEIVSQIENLPEFKEFCKNAGHEMEFQKKKMDVELYRIFDMSNPRTRIFYQDFQQICSSLINDPLDVKIIYEKEMSEKKRSEILTNYSESLIVSSYKKKILECRCMVQDTLINDKAIAINTLLGSRVIVDDCAELAHAVIKYGTLEPKGLQGTYVEIIMQKKEVANIYDRLRESEEYKIFLQLFPKMRTIHYENAVVNFKRVVEAQLLKPSIRLRSDKIEGLLRVLLNFDFDIEVLKDQSKVGAYLNHRNAEDLYNSVKESGEYKELRERGQISKNRKKLLARLDFEEHVSQMVEKHMFDPETKSEINNSICELQLDRLLQNDWIAKIKKLNFLEDLTQKDKILRYAEAKFEDGDVAKLSIFIEKLLKYLEDGKKMVNRRPFERYLREDTQIAVQGSSRKIIFKRTSNLTDLQTMFVSEFGANVKFLYEGQLLTSEQFERAKYQNKLNLVPVRAYTVNYCGDNRQFHFRFGAQLLAELIKADARIYAPENHLIKHKGATLAPDVTVSIQNSDLIQVTRIRNVIVGGKPFVNLDQNLMVQQVAALLNDARRILQIKSNGLVVRGKKLKELNGNPITLDVDFEVPANPEDVFYAIISRRDLEAQKQSYSFFRKNSQETITRLKQIKGVNFIDPYKNSLPEKIELIWRELGEKLLHPDCAVDGIGTLRDNKDPELLRNLVNRTVQEKDVEGIMKYPEIAGPLRKKFYNAFKESQELQKVREIQAELDESKKY